MNTVRWNCHNHSNASDGTPDADVILAEAKRKRMVVGLTDHNTIGLDSDQSRGVQRVHELEPDSRNVVFGVEVQSKQNPEVIVVGEYDPLRNFFDDVVAPARSPSCPLYFPTNIDVAQLIDASRAFELGVIIPHPGLSHYGLLNAGLSESTLQRVFAAIGRHRGQVLTEINAMLPDSTRFATELREQTGIPIVAGADSHDGIIDRTFANVLIDSDDSRPLHERLFQAAHNEMPDVVVEKTSLARRLWHAARHIVPNMGLKGLYAYWDARPDFPLTEDEE